MIITIYKTGTFESAHQIDGHPKCGKLHGHSYRYEVWLSAERIDPEFGFVIDFHQIKEYFNKFDHSNEIIKVSCEQMVKDASVYFLRLSDRIVEAKIRIWETATSYAEILASLPTYEGRRN